MFSGVYIFENMTVFKLCSPLEVSDRTLSRNTYIGAYKMFYEKLQPNQYPFLAQKGTFSPNAKVVYLVRRNERPVYVQHH